VQAAKRVAAWLSTFPDPIGREVRIEDFSKRVGVTREALGLPGARPTPQPAARPTGPVGSFARSPNGVPQRGKVGGAPSGGKPITKADRAWIQAWTRPEAYASVFRWVEGELPPGLGPAEVFESTHLRLIAAAQGPGFGGGVPEEVSSEVRELIVAALMGEAKLPTEDEVQGSARTGLGRIWARFSQELKQALQDAEARNDFENRDRLMKEFLDVQRKIREFTRLL
jgi:hypothetical protein